MRITCPNCGAQYEVDDNLIPEAGRDVQCSNCGKGWFQAKSQLADSDYADEPDIAVEQEALQADASVGDALPAESDAPASVWDEAIDEVAAAPEAPEEVRADHDDATHVDGSAFEEPSVHADEIPTDGDTAAASLHDETPEHEDEADEASPAPVMTPRSPEDSVLAVLREEAEREIAARRAEASGLETQPDLGLDEAPGRRGSSLTGLEAAPAAAVAAGARRDLLPDIDEINSTLRSEADRGTSDYTEDHGPITEDRRRGFRLGFGIMILVAAVLIGLYVMSGWLAASVPALEPFMIAYVDWANGVRRWFDGLLAAGVDSLSG
jgi:predicted Zn finger-like uncharacterized protein